MSGTRPAGSPSVEFDKPGSHFVGVDRLDPEAGWNGYHRQLRQLLSPRQDQVVKLGDTQRRPRQPGAGHDSFRLEFGP